ncbi:hypothetical protein AAFF_G00019950 [Aldrovandia affinis]|uniref:Uncharacterized protein n=1 Tax=Aldrovandia affinis TaxID=143900 RepID=A0AAD7R4N5_9TELE|nr:hypothetical protein AAFF_G00019950 [Aldrovandia affinis]
MVAPAGRTPGCFTMARSPVTSSKPNWRATSDAISIIAAVQTCLSRTSLWTRMTYASPGWPSSPASASGLAQS